MSSENEKIIRTILLIPNKYVRRDGDISFPILKQLSSAVSRDSPANWIVACRVSRVMEALHYDGVRVNVHICYYISLYRYRDL